MYDFKIVFNGQEKVEGEVGRAAVNNDVVFRCMESG